MLLFYEEIILFFSSGITLNMDEEQELTSLNWLLTSNVMPSGIETVPIEAPSSSLPANASSPALAPTKSKRPSISMNLFFCQFLFLFLSFEIVSRLVFWTTFFISASLTQAHASKSRPKNSNVANLSSSSSKSKTSSPNNCAKKSSQSHSQSPNNATNKKKLLVSAFLKRRFRKESQ